MAKLDLRSAMVGEFPELQGTMGRYYALAAGLPEPVADAARDHYSPLGPSDAVPSAPVSVAVALADKLDTLVGFWAIDEKPTGSKDPFALRRAALGVIRLVLVNGVRVSLSKLFHTFGEVHLDFFFFRQRDEFAESESSLIAAGFDKPSYDQKLKAFEKTQSPEGARFIAALIAMESDLLAFFHDRLKVHLRDQGIRHDIIDAVLNMPGSDDLVLLVNRATALNDVLKTADGTNLLQGLKRAGNILAQAEEKDGVEYSFGADPKFAETDEERSLFAALDKAEPAIREAVRLEDFQAATQGIASLRAPIDAFFEAVQINTDNQITRRNRLNLLSRIREAGRLVADFGRIEG